MPVGTRAHWRGSQVLRLWLALAWGLSTGGCGGVVTVEADLTGNTAVTALQVSISLAGQLGVPEFYLIPGNRTDLPPVELPGTSSGPLVMEVYGLDTSRCIVAHGAGTAQVSGPGAYHALIPLSPATGCRVASDLGWQLFAIWGSGPSDLWSAGLADPLGSAGILLHGDGTHWTPVSYGTDQPLHGGWSSGPSEAWSVGDTGTIVHWDGLAWTPIPSGTLVNLYSVWGSAPSDIWAVGDQGTAVHWNGSSWTPVDSGTSARLQRVWGSGPGDVWAVAAGSSLMHWDGTSWSAHSVPSAPGFALKDAWGSGPDDIWALSNLPCPQAPAPFVETNVCTAWHWDGSAWTGSAVFGSSASPLEEITIWGSGPADFWIVNNLGGSLHWSGSAWMPVPTVPGAPPHYPYLWGTGPGDVWAVGSGGIIEHWHL